MLDRLDLVLILVLRHEQLDRDVEQRKSAHDLEPRQQHERGDDGGEDNAQDDGNARAQDHAPHPLAMGSPRQAIAMTTALSPDSRILIQMILRRATQNAVWPISVQPVP